MFKKRLCSLLPSRDRLVDSCVVGKLDDGGVTLGGDAVVGEEGAQKWAEHTPVGAPSAH